MTDNNRTTCAACCVHGTARPSRGRTMRLARCLSYTSSSSSHLYFYYYCCCALGSVRRFASQVGRWTGGGRSGSSSPGGYLTRRSRRKLHPKRHSHSNRRLFVRLLKTVCLKQTAVQFKQKKGRLLRLSSSNKLVIFHDE